MLAGHSQHFHLYLNGLYWGLYNAVEKPDESFTSAHLGGEPEEWDVLKHFFQVINGDRDAWDAARDIAQGGAANPPRVNRSSVFNTPRCNRDVPSDVGIASTRWLAATSSSDIPQR